MVGNLFKGGLHVLHCNGIFEWKEYVMFNLFFFIDQGVVLGVFSRFYFVFFSTFKLCTCTCVIWKSNKTTSTNIVVYNGNCDFFLTFNGFLYYTKLLYMKEGSFVRWFTLVLKKKIRKCWYTQVLNWLFILLLLVSQGFHCFSLNTMNLIFKFYFVFLWFVVLGSLFLFQSNSLN